MKGSAAPAVLAPAERDRLYARLAEAISAAGERRESLFLARLALLLLERLGDEAAGRQAIADALEALPEPSLSALQSSSSESSP